MKLEFHHINLVSKDDSKLHDFYTKILQLENIPVENFPRPEETETTGYSGEIKFATDGLMQMHLAEKDLNVSAKHQMHINPVEKGHIAFRTDDIQAFLKVLMFKFLNSFITNSQIIICVAVIACATLHNI